MKKFKMTKSIQVRISVILDERLKRVGDFLQLDRPDLIRMLISNGLKYWNEQRISQLLSEQKEKKDKDIQDILEIAKTKWIE